MQSIFRRSTYRLSFHFYRKFMWTLILFTCILWYTSGSLLGIGLIHVLFFAIVYVLYLEPVLRKQLDFYQNFGIPKLLLFVLSTGYSLVLAFLTYHILTFFNAGNR